MNLTKKIKKSIFREYDVRGKYKEDIDEEVAYTIGRSFGSYISEQGKEDCIIGYDNRYSSPSLAEALIKGIIESGIHVVCLGEVTTPMYYYACIKMQIESGIMVTASHNPKDDNGFKIAFDKSGNAKGKEIQDFYKYTIKQEFVSGDGLISYADIKDSYIKYLHSSIDINKPLRVIIDCGNGTTCSFVKNVFSIDNLEFFVLYGSSDPSFPNHHPDPSVDENMRVLANAVVELKADIGLAFDGDGDRLGVVDNLGRIVRVDTWMALFVRELMKTSENHKFLYDIKCGMTLIREIEKLNADGIMVRTGNSYTKALTRENDCIFGGEYSGHVYFRDKFLGFDSGFYAGLRILELLGNHEESLSEMVDSLEHFYSTGEMKYKTTDSKKFEIIKNINKYAKKQGYKYKTIDGVRVEFEDGSWVSVRASNTGPNLTMRVEATTENRKQELVKEFEQKIEEYNK